MPREQERVPYLIEIELECSSGRREARISDLSAGGCYIDSIAPVHDGEEICFRLREPGGSEFTFNGAVAYVLPGFGFGVKFAELSDGQKAFVENTIKANGG